MLQTSLLQSVELTDIEFEKISRLVYEQCGINLSDGKKELVKARLGKRIRAGQFKSFHDYYHHVVNNETGEELVYLLDSISTNFTFFFREPKHFDYIRSELLPELIKRKRSHGNRLRFWSAGCSSGEEPYSIVITLLEAIENPLAWDISILATDLSTKVLKTAESGVFHKERVHSISSPLLKKYILRGDGKWQDSVRVKDAVRKHVQFMRLNLMEPFSFKEPFDCIFCRNVMIYFDKKTQADLVARFYECLVEGGVLLIGHSESLTGMSHPFKYVRPAIYKK
ncbi:MAG: protein-glutamate O-methyltransferase CheR [Deltaproteobacteria bacterium]|nr:protein-glutamate O-methyltransferase CheR [Deltaproteobacteria bacterium]MDI6762184.1 protein-glutamate O-methyltransferase CheR [Thermodesulfobacteriota bacterium]